MGNRPEILFFALVRRLLGNLVLKRTQVHRLLIPKRKRKCRPRWWLWAIALLLAICQAVAFASGQATLVNWLMIPVVGMWMGCCCFDCQCPLCPGPCGDLPNTLFVSVSGDAAACCTASSTLAEDGSPIFGTRSWSDVFTCEGDLTFTFTMSLACFDDTPPDQCMQFELRITIDCLREPDADTETWEDDQVSCEPEEFVCDPLYIVFRPTITTGADCCSGTPDILVEITE